MTALPATYKLPYETPDSLANPTRPSRRVISIIRAYQLVRSGHNSPCRFYPSCSQYAIEAVQTHGTGRGLWFATKRVIRCRPFGAHGIDLVPVRKVR